MENKAELLDHGFVRLDGILADDLSVVNAARVSFATHHDVMELGDDKLIGFLMKNRHGTPFEHNLFRFHIKCPLFVAREWQRHRIGSYNEMSGRYVEMERAFYLPETLRTQVGKPGAYKFDDTSVPFGKETMTYIYDETWIAYQHLLDKGVAKEVARMVLPLALYTQFYWSVNARSLMNFLSLRNAEQAMFEIREYAKVVEGFFQEAMPVTAESFINNERIAP